MHLKVPAEYLIVPQKYHEDSAKQTLSSFLPTKAQGASRSDDYAYRDYSSRLQR